MKTVVREAVRRMSGYTPGEQPTASGVIKLNTNENPYPPSPAVGRALAALDPARLRLYPDPVCSRLRKRIAALHGCRDSQIFVGNGSDEVLALCTRAFVERDGSIGYFDPSYSLYPVLADILDVRKAPVDVGPDFGWRMPPDYRCSLFFLANPNAPTGMLHPREEVEAFCRRMPGVVVIDEAYVDFARENCMDLALSMDNVLAARTLSKSFSLAGLRVGYIVGPEPLIAALFKIKDSYNVDMLSQIVADAALSDPDSMLANVERIKATRRRVSEALAALGFKVYPSESNFIWTEPGACRAADLFEHLKSVKILIRYFPGPRTGNGLRVTMGADADMDRFLQAVQRYLEQGAGR